MPISHLISYNAAANASVRDYVALLKPRVMSLVVFTGMVGMFLSPGYLPPVVACMAIGCIALGGGAAGAINMWLERDSDALMERTKYRPIPAGRIAPNDAIIFAVSCAVFSVAVMAVITNYVAASLLLGAIVFYVFIYTLWLKPRTPMNIVIGGAAGALPPIIGWAAVTGNISIESIILFLIIFLWTPPHFWSLSLVASDDYKRAGIPMLPLTAGRDATLRQILAYTLVLLLVSLAPYALRFTGLFYAVGAFVLGIGFVFHATRLYRTKNLCYAMPMFKYSLLYLAGIFSLLVFDKMFTF